MAVLRTPAQIDERLTATLEAYHAAMRTGDLEAADVLYTELDDLLDERCHVPQPRLPSDSDDHTSPRPY